MHKERSTVEELWEELQGRSHDQMHFITESLVSDVEFELNGSLQLRS